MLYLLAFLVFQISAKILKFFRKTPIFAYFENFEKFQNFSRKFEKLKMLKIEHKILHIFAYYVFGQASLNKKFSFVGI